MENAQTWKTAVALEPADGLTPQSQNLMYSLTKAKILSVLDRMISLEIPGFH